MSTILIQIFRLSKYLDQYFRFIFMSIVNYDKIKELSIQKYRTMELAGDAFGIKRATFYNYISKKYGFTIDELLNISKILGCQLNDLLLTELDIIQSQPLVMNDAAVNYGHNHIIEQLKEKDNTIRAQSQTIESQKEFIEMLKEKRKDTESKEIAEPKRKQI